MNGIPCQLCGWQETAHDGGLSEKEALADLRLQIPLEGYEAPLVDSEGKRHHEYLSSNPRLDKENEERTRAGLDPKIV
jgi:hypothetical protein